MNNLIKKSKILFTLMFAFVALFTLGTANVSAAPSKITVQRAKTLEDMVTNYKYGFIVFTTDDGKIIYCVDPDKKALTTGMSASFSKDGDAGLLYILENGYPNKQITGNDEIDMYVTQAAVWWYMDETGQAGKFPDSFKNATTTDDYGLIPNYIKPMVAKAKAAKDTQVKPSIKISSNTSFSLTSDGKYYETGYISANVVGTSTYNVEINGGTANTVIVGENGNIGSTYNASSKFKVRVPASEVKNTSAITVKVSASGSVKKAKIYAPSDTANFQRVAGLYEETINANDSISLSIKTTEKHICEFTDKKYYGKDGKEVDKKTYNKECSNSCKIVDNKYYGKAGNEVDKATYESECSNICKVVNDKYYGKDGNVVDQDTYNKECGQEVVVPNTSANIVFWIVGLGILAIAGGLGFILYAGNKKTVKKA